MRKLLPYEHQLIESLGVTKEEYLKFVAIQQEYKDPKVGTALDVRNEAGTAALVLTIVGTLFQVGAALLAPKPEVPSGDARRRNRQQRFAPSFGFNSTQDLATYGDPVNLIYTDENESGDVRVGGSLVWSAIDNFGSTQFMRLLIVLGAGELQGISYKKTAFGQASLADLDKQGVFIFKDVNFDENDKAGPPTFGSLHSGFGEEDFFPTTLKPVGPNKPAFLIDTPSGKEKGFSQAYTPSTSTTLGVFDAIPINVDVKTRDKDGDVEESNNLVILPSGNESNNTWRNANGQEKQFDKGTKIEVVFRSGDHKPSSGQSKKQPRKTAFDMRRQMVDALDFGSTYMLGTAKFRLLEYEDTRNNPDRTITDKLDLRVKFQCIEDGQVPGTPYSEQDPDNDLKDIRRAFVKAKRILSAKNDDFNDEHFKAKELVVGDTYRVRAIKGTDFTEIGADFNNIGEIFVAEKVTAEGTGEISNASVEGVSLDVSGIDKIDFNGTETKSWTPEFVSSVSKDFNKDNGKDNVQLVSKLRKESAEIIQYGSILYTQSLKEDVGADAPTLDTDQLRKDVKRQRGRLRRLIREIEAGTFDGLNGDLLQCNNDYEKGFNTNNSTRRSDGSNHVVRWPLKTLNGETGGNYKVFDNVLGTSNYYFFTFAYIDATGKWNLFNFNGVQQIGNSELLDFFPNDQALISRRNRLNNIEEDIYDKLKDNTTINKGKNNNLTKIKESARQSGPSDKDGRTFLNKNTGLTNKKFSTIQDKYTKRQNRIAKIQERVQELIDAQHAVAIKVIEEDIELLDQLLGDIPAGKKKNDASEGIRDRVGTREIRKAYKKLIREKKKALGDIQEILDDWQNYSQSFDNNFFSKCLVKAETASYSTLSECDVVNFSFKTKLFRRISGRQKKYGEQRVREYSNSDNGVKSRMVFFRMTYQEYLSNGEVGDPYVVPHVFAIRRGSESDFYTQIGFHTTHRAKWKFTFIPVYDIVAEKRHRNFTKFFFLENTDSQRTKSMSQVAASGSQTIFWYGREVSADSSRSNYPDEVERGPIYTNEWDMFSVNSDTQVQFSFESGPEIELTAVTEQQLDSVYDTKYKNLSMIGVGVFAGRGLQNLRNITALVNKGKLCRTVEDLDSGTTTPTKSSSFAPDIFVDTLLDKDNGIGKYIEAANLDTESLKEAKAFCTNNNLPVTPGLEKIELYMDGIIADAGSWREFWIANAPFSLLELARKNGKETLVPALPVNASGEAADDAGLPVEIKISALFTTGNILEGSYREEFLDFGAATEDLIATVIYRDYIKKEVFSQNRSVEVRLIDVEDESSAIRETFDLSQFVTQREQAIMFGKLLCNQRRHIRRGIEFKTFPTEAIVEPGAFIYVDVGVKQWDHYSSGVVTEGGVLNAPLMRSQRRGTYDFNFLLYNKSEEKVVALSDVSVFTARSGISTASSLSPDYEGYMFVMGANTPSKRVYRVTEVGIEEEGEVSVKAIEYPCFEEDGKTRASIADFRSSNFEVS